MTLLLIPPGALEERGAAARKGSRSALRRDLKEEARTATGITCIDTSILEYIYIYIYIIYMNIHAHVHICIVFAIAYTYIHI